MYETAELAFRAMKSTVNENHNQSIIVSGESGAGKVSNKLRITGLPLIPTFPYFLGKIPTFPTLSLLFWLMVKKYIYSL